MHASSPACSFCLSGFTFQKHKKCHIISHPHLSYENIWIVRGPANPYEVSYLILNVLLIPTVDMYTPANCDYANCVKVRFCVLA